jgi:aryl-alcohol dehydrogenase-like predicted oxidoreductase
MQTRQLGTSDLHLTTVGFGTWAIGGGDWAFGWGPQDDAESVRAIHRALDLGVNWIDTAAVYGLGHSEEVVARALADRRGKVIVATKCGLRWRKPMLRREASEAAPSHPATYGKLTAKSIREEVEASLRRLGLEAIDLYQIHWPNPDKEIEEGWHTMAELVREGKVRWAGVSNFNVAQLKRAQQIHPVASLQPPYSMLRRDAEAELLPHCAAQQIGVVVYSPMQAGLLTGGFMSRERLEKLDPGDWRRRDRFFQEPAFSQAIALVEKLRPIAARAGRTLAQLAIAWALRRPEVTAAIVGARSARQIEETAAAGDWVLSPELQAEVEHLLEGHGRAS